MPYLTFNCQTIADAIFEDLENGTLEFSEVGGIGTAYDWQQAVNKRRVNHDDITSNEQVRDIAMTVVAKLFS